MKKGLTLIELLLAIGLAGLVSVLFSQFIFNTFRSYNKGQTYSRLQNDLVSSSTLLEKELRATTEVVAAAQNTLTVRAYAVSESAPVDQIRYFIDGNQLKRGLIPPTGSPPGYTYDAGNEQIKILASNVVSNPIFTYFDQDGVQIPSPVITPANVTLVEINLAIDDNITAPPEPAATSLKIQLRNRKTNN